MTGKKPIVKIRVYRGLELNYDAKGNVKNENFLISVEHGTNLWKLTMKNLRLNGYCKVEVDSVWQVEEEGYSEIKDNEIFVKEVQKSFENNQEITLTADQKRIAELEAKLENLINLNSNIKETKKVEKTSDINDLREEYFDLYHKKPFAGWKEEKLITLIEEKK